MAVAPTPVAAAPDAPDRAQRATFSARATAFFDWIKNTFVAGVNALASNVYANAQDAASSAANAVAQSASATAQAGIATAQAAAATSAAATATTQAGVATTQAASITTAAATSTAKADVATAKAAEATAAAATATAIVLGVATGYPIIRPSLTLDFANSQIFDPRITFTRASAATRVNSMGLIETVASGVPRLTFAALTGACEGYLVEEQRTNMCTWSDSPRTAMSPWKCALIETMVLAPDGVCVANKLVEDTSSNTHNASVSLSVTAGTTYTFSAFVKAGERTSASVALNAHNGAFAFTEISVNLETGECAVLAGSPVSYGAVPFKSGWWRAHITGTAIATAAGIPSVGARSTSSSYTGDGTSGIYLWGTQHEPGSFPTSYIRSGGAATTRAADVAVMTGVDFASWYRQDEGTFVVNGKCSQPVPAAQYPRLLQVGTSSANTMAVLFDGGSWLYASSVFGGAEVFNAGATRTATVDNRVSMAYKRDDYALSINGGVAAADTTGDVPTVTRLAVGLDYGAWGFFNGTISDLTYYPLRLTNAELQALSAQ